jgi:hypothetical protein
MHDGSEEYQSDHYGCSGEDEKKNRVKGQKEEIEQDLYTAF